MKDFAWLTSNTRMICSIIVEHGNGNNLCHWRRYSPEAIFKFVLREGCFVVAHLSVIPKICKISATMIKVNADRLSVMRVVDTFECLS